MSGFSDIVSARVSKISSNKFKVACVFPNMLIKLKKVKEFSNTTLVDMGGIVHVVIEDDFPCDNFKLKHQEITERLCLEGREAVGVVWVQKCNIRAKIDPVVWVKNVNSFFYESSCGSGSIAAALVTNLSCVVQPSGQSIEVWIERNRIILSSEMEIIGRK